MDAIIHHLMQGQLMIRFDPQRHTVGRILIGVLRAIRKCMVMFYHSFGIIEILLHVAARIPNTA